MGMNGSVEANPKKSMAHLEESARDRKIQLEDIIIQLKKIATHLYSITNEEVSDGNFLED